MANKKLGIHFAPGALKRVELEQQAKKFRVLSHSIDYFPLESKLDAQLKKGKIHAKEATLALTGVDIVYKLLEMPELSEKDLVSAIRYKLKAVLPLSFKEIVVDYYKVDQLSSKGKHLYFVAAAPREKILEVIESAKAAGLSIKDIVAPSSALKNVVSLPATEVYAVIYLGRFSSLIILVRQGQVVFAREVGVGGEDITQAMLGAVQAEGERFELDYKRAEEIKNEYGIPLNPAAYSKEAGVPADELMAMMRPALEKIAAEILNTFDYYRQEIGDATEFKKIYFTGGASTLKNLLEYFKDQLEIEVAPLPMSLADVPGDFAAKAPFLSLALGSMIAEKDRLSLVPKERGELLLGNLVVILLKAVRQWFKYIFMGATYLLLLVFVFTWYSFQQKDLLALHKSLEKDVAKLGIETKMSGEMTDLIKYSQRDGFTLTLLELDKITPNDIYFKDMSYDNKTSGLSIKGIVLVSGGETSMANFIERLNKSRYFKSADLVFLQESDLYTVSTYEFELKCLLAGEARK